MADHLAGFVSTIAQLRAPDGCPWDREQTHATLARYLLEEAYEVLEAIHLGDPEKLKEELGDLLLQIVLNAQIASENGHFDIQDVACAINEKMIKRHPHVFADACVKSADDVVAQWEELKERERLAAPFPGQENTDAAGAAATGSRPASAMDGVPRTLPALLAALKVSEKAVAQGFEWRNEEEVWAKLDSELGELKEEIARASAGDNRREVDLELGDVLFVMVNIARWRRLNPEESLLLATEKFKERFRKMEALADRPLKEHTKDELAVLWQKAKSALSAS